MSENILKSDITFLVFAYNEENRIEYILRCIQGYGEIVVIDNFSQDKTIEVGKKFTDKVYQFKNPGFIENEETMSFVLDKVKTKWVYITYVDELIPKPLLRELVRLSNQSKYKIVEIYRKDFMFGEEIFNYGRYKFHLRMFVKGSVDFKGNLLHKFGSYLVSRNEVLKIERTDDTSIWHFGSYNAGRLEMAQARYADLEAKQRHDIGQTFSGIRALSKLIVYFFGTYFWASGFKGGWPGFFISLRIAYSKFAIEFRLWELDHNINMESIERKYEIFKERLLNTK